MNSLPRCGSPHALTRCSKETCTLDPIPSWLVASCAYQIVPVVTHIVNASLFMADVPSNLKQAVVTPILKNNKLDKDNLNNYRPISNLSLLSNIVEKIVTSRMHSFLQNNNMFPKFQSAYRPLHSTETALVRVHNHIVKCISDKNDVILILLDLSSAFDTIDNHLLLERLRDAFGFRGSVLDWFDSYFTGRTQSISVNNAYFSNPSRLIYVVPQGSVLGPSLFILYIVPLYEIISRFFIDFHFYADDNQLMFPINPVE